MDGSGPVFRIGRTNHYVRPGDVVWADRVVARVAAPGQFPVVTEEPVCGRVCPDGTVLLATGGEVRFVPLDQCRMCETVIRV